MLQLLHVPRGKHSAILTPRQNLHLARWSSIQDMGLWSFAWDMRDNILKYIEYHQIWWIHWVQTQIRLRFNLTQPQEDRRTRPRACAIKRSAKSNNIRDMKSDKIRQTNELRFWWRRNSLGLSSHYGSFPHSLLGTSETMQPCMKILRKTLWSVPLFSLFRGEPGHV